MNTQRPSNERVRPLFNALQFIEPSSAPFHAAATETSPDKLKDFLAVPQKLRGDMGATARTIPKAKDVDFLVGTDARSNDELVGRPKTPTKNNRTSNELQNNLNKKGVQVPKQDAKKSMHGVLSAAETVPLFEEELDKQGDEQSSMQGAMQGEAPVDMPWDSSTTQPSYPRQRDTRLKASLRLDLMTSPSIERALRGATARLGLLLSDYRDCRPDISPNRLHLLGYGLSRAT